MEEYQGGLERIIDDDLFKVLSEPVRIRILKYLATAGASDIGTIAAEFTQDRSVISRHLKMMHAAGLLSAEKRARNTVYDIDGYAILARLEGITGMVRLMLERFCPDSSGRLEKKT